jgi:hypothetical protein
MISWYGLLSCSVELCGHRSFHEKQKREFSQEPAQLLVTHCTRDHLTIFSWSEPVLRIRITLGAIRIRLFTFDEDPNPIRIRLLTLMRIRMRRFTVMRIRIRLLVNVIYLA